MINHEGPSITHTTGYRDLQVSLYNMTSRPLSIPKKEDIEIYKYQSKTGLRDLEVSLYNRIWGFKSILTQQHLWN